MELSHIQMYKQLGPLARKAIRALKYGNKIQQDCLRMMKIEYEYYELIQEKYNEAKYDNS
jgi:hypothetical protein